MKKFSTAFLIIAAVIVLSVAAITAALGGAPKSHAASAHTNPSLFALEHQHGKAGGNPTNAGSTYTCPGAVSGNLIINVTEKVINDADSGQAGNYWAFDAFTRTIKVWNTGSDDSYCAVVSYKGTFAAQAGQQSPGSVGGNGGILTGDEIGTMNGAAQLFITGPLNISNPANWPLLGKVNQGNTVDYQCDITGNCPGYVNWMAQYFDTNPTVFSYTEPNWGWKYVGKDKPGSPDAGTSDGVWYNASTGNSGDILDLD